MVYASPPARDKAKMQALVAVMRKLLHAIFGMFKHQQPFDGTKLYRQPADSSLPQPIFSTAEVPCAPQREKSPAPSKEKSLLKNRRESTRWLVGEHLADSRTARHPQFRLANPLR